MAWNIGDACSVNTEHGRQDGIIRYIGPIASQKKGTIYAGIELEAPKGKNAGDVKGTFYFRCRPGYGIFAPQNILGLPVQPEEPAASEDEQVAVVADEAAQIRADAQILLRPDPAVRSLSHREQNGSSGREESSQILQGLVITEGFAELSAESAHAEQLALEPKPVIDPHPNAITDFGNDRTMKLSAQELEISSYQSQIKQLQETIATQKYQIESLTLDLELSKEDVTALQFELERAEEPATSPSSASQAYELSGLTYESAPSGSTSEEIISNLRFALVQAADAHQRLQHEQSELVLGLQDSLQRSEAHARDLEKQLQALSDDDRQLQDMTEQLQISEARVEDLASQNDAFQRAREIEYQDQDRDELKMLLDHIAKLEHSQRALEDRLRLAESNAVLRDEAALELISLQASSHELEVLRAYAPLEDMQAELAALECLKCWDRISRKCSKLLQLLSQEQDPDGSDPSHHLQILQCTASSSVLYLSRCDPEAYVQMTTETILVATALESSLDGLLKMENELGCSARVKVQSMAHSLCDDARAATEHYLLHEDSPVLLDMEMDLLELSIEWSRHAAELFERMHAYLVEEDMNEEIEIEIETPDDESYCLDLAIKMRKVIPTIKALQRHIGDLMSEGMTNTSSALLDLKDVQHRLLRLKLLLHQMLERSSWEAKREENEDEWHQLILESGIVAAESGYPDALFAAVSEVADAFTSMEHTLLNRDQLRRVSYVAPWKLRASLSQVTQKEQLLRLSQAELEVKDLKGALEAGTNRSRELEGLLADSNARREVLERKSQMFEKSMSSIQELENDLDQAKAAEIEARGKLAKLKQEADDLFAENQKFRRSNRQQTGPKIDVAMMQTDVGDAMIVADFDTQILASQNQALRIALAHLQRERSWLQARDVLTILQPPIQPSVSSKAWTSEQSRLLKDALRFAAARKVVDITMPKETSIKSRKPFDPAQSTAQLEHRMRNQNLIKLSLERRTRELRLSARNDSTSLAVVC